MTETKRFQRMYPDDGGLGPQLRPLDQTMSGFDIIREAFQVGCPVCGLKSTDAQGRLVPMGYCCPRNDCPTQARITS